MTARKPWQHHDGRHGRQPKGDTTARGYGWAWQQLRLRILERDGHLCQECQRQGRVTLATDVHHVTAKAKGGTDDPDNLMSVCLPCHKAATIAEQGGRRRREVGLDGYPLE